MTTAQALFIGLLQGATELFPVSSLGHAVILPSLLHWGFDQSNSTFLPFLVHAHSSKRTWPVSGQLADCGFVDKPPLQPQTDIRLISCAQVAELADALASGASGLTVVEVRVLSWAPFVASPMFLLARNVQFALSERR